MKTRFILFFVLVLLPSAFAVDNTGTLIITSKASFADIYLDDEKTAADLPAGFDEKAVITGIQPGTHHIRIEAKASGTEWFSGTLNIAAGQTIKAKAEPGEFTILSVTDAPLKPGDKKELFSSNSGKPAIAILDLEEIGSKKGTARAVSEVLRTELTDTGSFKVIERAQLDKVMKEMKFSNTEFVDPATAARFGKLVGAKYVALGSVAVLGKTYTVSMRFIDVETAESVLGKSLTVKSEDELPDVCRQMADAIAGVDRSKPVAVSPSEPKPVFTYTAGTQKGKLILYLDSFLDNVYIDDMSWSKMNPDEEGENDAQIYHLSPGIHYLRVTGNWKKPFDTKVEIKSGESQVLRIKLEDEKD